MTFLQKKSDGIRKSGVSGPIRLSPKEIRGPGPEQPRERETELHWDEERDGEVMHEMRAGGTREEMPDDAPILHEPAVLARERKRPRLRLFLKKQERAAPSGERRSVPGSWMHRGLYVGGIAAVMIFILISTVFARLTVTVRPRAEEAAIERVGALFDASVSKVLFSQRVIPAEVLHFSRAVSRDFPATGSGRVEERARGMALIYNGFNSQPQTLIAGTRFASEGGAIYRIKKQVTVPGAKIEQGAVVPQSVEAELVADVAGDGANASGSVSLKLPGFAGSPRSRGFYAIAPRGFAGGFIGDTAVVSRDDVERAEEEVSKAAFDDVESEMQKNIPAGLITLKELREIEISKMDAPKAGSRSPKPFSVSAEARGTALAFREQDVIDLLASFALAERTDQEFIPGSARLSYAVRSVDFEKGKAEVALGGKLNIKAKIPERELAALISGKKEGSVRELFKQRRELARFRLSFFPPWRSTTPKDLEKIRFRVESP